MKNYIKNIEQLSITPERKDILSIIESAYQAIDTTEIINMQEISKILFSKIYKILKMKEKNLHEYLFSNINLNILFDT